MKIIFYDKYCDIPERGVLQMEAAILAFVARIMDDDSMELSMPGVFCQVAAFPCDEQLFALFKEKETIFNSWKREWDAGIVETANHPLYKDARYQQISAQIDKIFAGFRSPVFEATGMMIAESAKFAFQPCKLSNESPDGERWSQGGNLTIF